MVVISSTGTAKVSIWVIDCTQSMDVVDRCPPPAKIKGTEMIVATSIKPSAKASMTSSCIRGCVDFFMISDPGGIQTHDFRNRNPTFYSAELRGQISHIITRGKNKYCVTAKNFSHHDRHAPKVCFRHAMHSLPVNYNELVHLNALSIRFLR